MATRTIHATHTTEFAMMHMYNTDDSCDADDSHDPDASCPLSQTSHPRFIGDSLWDAVDTHARRGTILMADGV